MNELMVFIGVVVGLYFYLDIKKSRDYNRKMRVLMDSSILLSSKEFLKMRTFKFSGEKAHATSINVITGVYVLINKTKN